MKLDFRGGVCLAVLMAGLACTQPPQSPTTPSATTGGFLAAAADGSTLKVTAPALLRPIDGERAEDRRPSLLWLNSNGRYGSIGVAYDLEISNPSTVVYSRTVGESPDYGAHLVDLELDYDTVYSWRARARVGDMLGPWSSWATFLSPRQPVVVAPPPTAPTGGGTACAAPLSPMGPGETRKPRPNESAIVGGIASQFPHLLRNSCQDHGGSWEFMDRVVDALRAKDGRWGYNAKRGVMHDASHDVVSYYYSNAYPDIEGRFEVYIIDIIGGHCGSSPFTVWLDVTDETARQNTSGRTMYPRPGGPTRSPACAASR